MEWNKKIKHVHDRFFRESMEQKEIAIGIVQDFIDRVISKDIDFSTLEIIKDDWIDTALSEHKADILYRASLLNHQGDIYLLFEHKSYIDNKVEIQLMRYMIQIWTEIEKQNSRTSKLPVVISIIVYHGLKTWNASNSTKSQFEIIKGTEKFIPDFQSVIIDLAVLDDENMGNNVEQKAFLLALKYSQRQQILRKLPVIIRMFNGLGERDGEYLLVVLKYIGSVIPERHRDEFLEIIKLVHGDGVSFMKTIADSLRKEGWTMGKKEGKIEGKREGEAKGKKEGKLEGKLEDKLEIARRMLSKKMSIDTIHELTDLTIEQIKKL